MANFFFKQGFTYVAGVDKPGVVSESTIIEAVADMGFRVLFAGECNRMPSFPFRVPGRCDDEWDWIGYVERTGPSQSIDVPGRVKWIQEVPKPLPAPLPGDPLPVPEPLPPSWENPDPPESGPAAPGAVAQAGFGGGSKLVPAIVGGVAGILLVRWLWL